MDHLIIVHKFYHVVCTYFMKIGNCNSWGVHLICRVIIYSGKYGITERTFKKFKAKNVCTISLYFIIKYVDQKW